MLRLQFLLLFVIIFCLFNDNAVAEKISVIDKSLGSPMGSIESVRVGRFDYVSAVSFANTLNLGYDINPFLKKVSLQTPKNLITITALNPYVLIDNAVYQMPVNTLYKDKQIYIPIIYFVELLKDHFLYELEYNELEKALLVTTNLANIAKVVVEEMENGVLIQINSLKKFSTSNIFTSESNGWFYVDFFGGRVDTLRAFPVDDNLKKVKQIVPFQLSEDTARLSFRVLPEIKEKNVYLKTPKEVIITLRTKKKLSENSEAGHSNKQIAKLLQYVRLLSKLEKDLHKDPYVNYQERAAFYRNKAFHLLDWMGALIGISEQIIIVNTLMQVAIHFQKASFQEANVSLKMADEKMAIRLYLLVMQISRHATPDVELYIQSQGLKFLLA